MIKIRAFRAIDEPQTCHRFLAGHRKVLEEFNLENISTNTPLWIEHANTYVVIGEYEGELIGGIRVQIADGNFPLPVEDAVGHYDANIHKLVKKYSDDEGVGELCGLWNSRKLPPNLGITVLLSIAAVSVCNQIKIKHLFAIVAGYTLAGARRLGFEIEKSVGNNGEFTYPNSNFVARVLRMNCLTLTASNAQYKIDILELRENRQLAKKIKAGNMELDSEYNLELNTTPPIITNLE
ncbi:MAG: hypothetical protein NTW54_06470 [Bacteroidetes bacterium]|nr:hypothetical protein [Bacteroidota bacterium]